jgi:hypothetical protein
LFNRGLEFFHPAHAPSVAVNGISGNSRVIRDVCPDHNSVKERGRVKQIYAALRSRLASGRGRMERMRMRDIEHAAIKGMELLGKAT